MEQSRLYQSIRQLDKKGFDKFSKWLASPYHNQDEALCRLWAYLSDGILYLKLPPEKEKAFKKAYPDKAYKPQMMRLLMSRLYKQLEQYLAWRELEQEPKLLNRFLVKGLRKRKSWKDFKRVLEHSLKKLKDSTQRNAEYFNALLQLQEEFHHLQSTVDPTDVTHLQQMAKTMDQAYLLQRIRQSCRLLAHSSVYQSETEDSVLDSLLDLVRDSDLIQLPSIQLYYNCYQMLKAPKTDACFFAFKQSLFAHGHLVSPSELRDLYLLAINHCVRRVNDNNKTYYQQLYTLYQKGLETEALIENKILSRFTYHNIVTTGLRIHEYDWVEQFISDYQSYLERTHRETSYNFCRAHLLYHLKKYDKALTSLRIANYRDPLLNLSAKTLLLKIYYETGEHQLLHAHLDAMRNYVQRKEVIGYHKTNYLNIIRFSRKLMTVNPFDKDDQEKLYLQIEAEAILTEKQWLLEQMKKLS